MGASEDGAARGLIDQLAAFLANRRRGAAAASPPLVLAMAHATPSAAAEVADAVDADLDVVETREIHVRGNPEALGAVTADGPPYFRRQALARVGRREESFARAVDAQRCEARKLLRGYHSELRAQRIAGRNVVLVDDGFSTEVAIVAALRQVRDSFPGCLVFASPSTAHADAVRREADSIVFGALPSHTGGGRGSEQEIRQLLRHNRKRAEATVQS